MARKALYQLKTNENKKKLKLININKIEIYQKNARERDINERLSQTLIIKHVVYGGHETLLRPSHHPRRRRHWPSVANQRCFSDR